MKINLMDRCLTSAAVIAFAALAMTSCKDDINIDDTKNEEKIVVYCFPTVGDTTYIEVSRSLPVQRYRNWVQLTDIADATVSYTVNGQSLPVTNDGDGRYHVVGRQRAGDEVSLAVSATGLPSVTANTTIPDTVAIGSPARREVKIYDDDREETRTYEQLMATFADPAQNRDYYATRVQVRYLRGVGHAFGHTDLANVEDVFYTQYEYRETISNPDVTWDSIVVRDPEISFYYPEINTKNEPLLLSMTGIDDDFGFSNHYFGRLYIFDDAPLTASPYTLHLNVEDDDVSVDAALETHVRVELMHMTPEFYRFLRSINAAENSDLARYGLSQLMPTASNVTGGLGVVGGWNASHTQWFTPYE